MKQRTLISVVGVLLIVAVIGFVLTGEEPLYGQGNQTVLDLIGVWELSVSAYFFDDVIDPGDPVFIQVSGDELHITAQTGGVFAGSFDGSKITGVILPDGTVSVQAFELSELRFFFTGSVGRRGNTPRISGFVHIFDDFGAEDPSGDRNMASGLFQIVKVN